VYCRPFKHHRTQKKTVQTTSQLCCHNGQTNNTRLSYGQLCQAAPFYIHSLANQHFQRKGPLIMALPSDSPPAYDAPYVQENGTLDKAQPLGNNNSNDENGLPVVDLDPIYRFHSLRWWIVGTVVRLLAWEPVSQTSHLFESEQDS
jgi:hypothetical protein